MRAYPAAPAACSRVRRGTGAQGKTAAPRRSQRSPAARSKRRSLSSWTTTSSRDAGPQAIATRDCASWRGIACAIACASLRQRRLLELSPIGGSHAPTSCLCAGRDGTGQVALPLVVRLESLRLDDRGARLATKARVTGDANAPHYANRGFDLRSSGHDASSVDRDARPGWDREPAWRQPRDVNAGDHGAGTSRTCSCRMRHGCARAAAAHPATQRTSRTRRRAATWSRSTTSAVSPGQSASRCTASRASSAATARDAARRSLTRANGNSSGRLR